MELDEQTRLLVVRARLGPSLAIPTASWCHAPHPAPPVGSSFICSRELGHKGPHFAQYVDGTICKCDPNPWENNEKNSVEWENA